MIGFAIYSPSVLALLVNREEFYPFVVHNASESSVKKIRTFLDSPDNRVKVVIFASVDILKDISEIYNLDNIKIIVLDTVSNLSRVDLQIKDVQIKADNSYQFFTITPSDFNKALRDCDVGIPESGIRNASSDENLKLRAQIIRKNIVPEKKDYASLGELSFLIRDLVENLGNREKYIVSENVVKYIVGIIGVNKFKSICSTYDIKCEKIIEFVKDSKGKALRLAFLDSYIYKTDSLISVKESNANKLDFDFITSFLPLDKEYSITVKVPPSLISKRKMP